MDITPNTIEINKEGELIKYEVPCFNIEYIDVSCIDIISKTYKMALKNIKESQILDYLLSYIMECTESKSGVICIKRYNEDNTYRLDNICMQIEKEKNIIGGWHNQLINILETNKDNLTFHTDELNSLFSRSLKKDTIVLCNDYSNDPRRGDLPQGHMEMKSFYSIPISYKHSYIGILNIANGIYDINTFTKISCFLEPIAYFINKISKPVIPLKNEVEESKDDFLSMISHEIRTPLTGIVSMAQLIPEMGPLNEKQKEYISQQNICIHQLMELLNDLIDFQTLKANRLKLRFAPFDLKECIDTAIIVVKDKAISKNLKLTQKYPSRKYPSRIIGDMQHLRQILINLLSNSVKFTDSGSIKITVKAVPFAQNNIKNQRFSWRIIISVSDTGIGVPKSDQALIFAMFKQCNNSKCDTRNRGLGLGLAISKSLIELMGGEIKVESEGIPGKGSTFTIHIPVEEEISVADILVENQNILQGTPILAVDDKKQNRIVINEYLFKWGCRPVTVESADEALQHLRVHEEFKAILIDIHMPLMGGIELSQKIKQMNISTPLIALSSVPSSENGQNLFDFYLYKPLVEHQLLKCIISCIKTEPKEINKSEQFEIVKKKKEELKILIADDDMSNRYSIRELLICLGLSKENIKIVDNGKSCVNEVSRNFYDVVFMDIKMPVMDGIEATKIIMNLDRSPTIIAISAGVSDVNKEKCQQVGMSGYLIKPIVKEDLLMVLSGFL